MNRFVLFVACFAVAISASASDARTEYDVVSVPVNEVFVPVGFDDNDRVEVVLDGYLPDTCHKLADVTVTVDNEARTLTLDQKAKRVLGACTDVTVPFSNVLSLGTLQTGTYKIKLASAQESQPLEVTKAPVETPDDFLYAPVDNISVERKDGEIYARIEGRYTSSCLGMDRFEVYHTGKTIQVLPIMKYSGLADGPCEVNERPFKEYVALPNVEAVRHLLHVRSLEGGSKNLVFNPAAVKN
ncbi:MAG: hypothetical protein KDD51_05035 [Bdellovibrionales bacterium]|nr:hypothetical protein [Bdellovibrionales bacterium]